MHRRYEQHIHVDLDGGGIKLFANNIGGSLWIASHSLQGLHDVLR